MNLCKRNCSCSSCKPSGFPVSRVLRGIDACQIPHENPSSSCCPKYFFNQNQTGIPIPLGTIVEVISVPVTTNSFGERVRIASMNEIRLIAGEATNNYSFSTEFRLFRDTQLLTSISFVRINQFKQVGVAVIIDNVNITWTDIPPGPGTFVYRIVIERFPLTEVNISFVEIRDKSIDAIVFPPVNSN